MLGMTGSVTSAGRETAELRPTGELGSGSAGVWVQGGPVGGGSGGAAMCACGDSVSYGGNRTWGDRAGESSWQSGHISADESANNEKHTECD